MKDSSSRAFTRSTRAFQHLEYEQETARDDNAEELYVAFVFCILLCILTNAREGKRSG